MQLCAELEVDFEALCEKVAQARACAMRNRANTWAIVFTRDELQVIAASLEIAGES